MARWTLALNEPELARSARRGNGVYYTPPEIVRFICERTIRPLLGCPTLQVEPPRVLDPTCGAGAFLIEAAESLFRARRLPCDPALVSERFAVVRKSIFGIDIDRNAVTQARLQLAKTIAGAHAAEAMLKQVAADLSQNVIQADTLLDGLPTRFTDESFDIILGNPPYVNIRQLARQQGAGYLTQLRGRYPTATGNFDLYIPFIERARQLLRVGGHCAFILPNKIAGLGYAAECRRMLLEQTRLDYFVDLSASRVFAAAGVYPWIVGWQKGTPAAGHKLTWHRATDCVELESAPLGHQVEQATLQADGFRLRSSAGSRSETVCQPLGQLATLECGTAGYTAMRIAHALQEAVEGATDVGDQSRLADFIVSGNIDRYAIETGNVRYLGQRYQRPRISLDSPTLTARQRRLFAQPKIVVSGMTRRLEAAYDGQGLALGVQVYAVLPPAEDLYYVLGLLNSRWLSYWFRQQFAAKQLAGGYLGINKAQLTQLPIRVVRSSERADVRRRRAVAEAAEALNSTDSDLSTATREIDRHLDQLVYELYQLNDAQIAECELQFETTAPYPTRRAA